MAANISSVGLLFSRVGWLSPPPRLSIFTHISNAPVAVIRDEVFGI